MPASRVAHLSHWRLYVLSSLLLSLIVGAIAFSPPVSASHGGDHFSLQGWYGTITWSGIWHLESQSLIEDEDSSATFAIFGADQPITASASIDRVSTNPDCATNTVHTSGSATGIGPTVDFHVDYNPATDEYTFAPLITEPFAVHSSGFDCGGSPIEIDFTLSAPYNTQLITDTLENGVLEGSVDLGAGFGVFTWRLTQTAPPTPPTVVSYAPADGATDVPVSALVAVTWSQVMSESTVFSVDGPDGGVNGTFALDASGLTVTFTPDVPFDAGTTYEVLISGQVDANGVVQQVPVAFSFTTAPRTLESIAITPESLVLHKGDQVQLTAIGYYDDGSTEDLTALVDWFSSKPQRVTVTSFPDGGLVTAKGGKGTVIITAKLGLAGPSGQMTVTVVPGKVT